MCCFGQKNRGDSKTLTSLMDDEQNSCPFSADAFTKLWCCICTMSWRLWHLSSQSCCSSVPASYSNLIKLGRHVTICYNVDYLIVQTSKSLYNTLAICSNMFQHSRQDTHKRSFSSSSRSSKVMRKTSST